jgi:hypothetical protein
MMQQRKSQKRSKNPRFFSRHLIFAGSIIHHPSSNANELKKRRSMKLKLTSFVCVHKKTKWRQDESIATTTATTSEKQQSRIQPGTRYLCKYLCPYLYYVLFTNTNYQGALLIPISILITYTVVLRHIPKG